MSKLGDIIRGLGKRSEGEPFIEPGSTKNNWLDDYHKRELQQLARFDRSTAAYMKAHPEYFKDRTVDTQEPPQQER